MAEWITTGPIALPQSWHEFAGGTFDAAGYEWQARTADAQGEWGPWSGSSFFTAATPPPGPTILEPANGATIGTQSFTLRWSYPNQAAYQAQLLDGAGNVVTDLGEVASATTRSASFGNIPNNVTRTARVRIREVPNGPWSGWSAVSVDVSYTAPATPTVEVDVASVPGAIRVRGSLGVPANGEPAVTHLDIYRRERANPAEPIRRAKDLAPSQVFDDHFVAAGVEYDYRVLAYGSNGTTAWSEWSGEPAPIYVDLDGGSPSETGDTIYDGGPI